METIKSCELCLKQIIKTEDFENLHCDEKRNLKILKNLDITVSKDAKICSNCVNISHLMYNFKMSRLTNNDHLKTLIHPGIKDKLILEEIVVEETKNEFKNEKKVCRLCLNFSEVNSLVDLEQDVVLKDMLQRCLPQIDMNIVQNPLICSICSELLEKLFNFFSQCEDTEVLSNLNTKTDFLVNENMPTVPNNDDNIDNSFMREKNCEGIEYPELQIKSEDFDIDDDTKDVINDSNPVEEKDVTAKPHGTIKEKKFVCDICSYQANRNDHLKEHYVIHKEPSEVDIFKCDYCPFATKWKPSLIQHAKCHKNPSMLSKFKCNYCTYKTNIRKCFDGHVQLHKNHSQVNMCKCKMCPFQTKHNRYIGVHRNQHQVEIYTCDICNYKSKLKHSFMLHFRYHKEWKQPEKSNQNLIKVKQYKCNKCYYVGAQKAYLIRHQMIHKDPSEREMYNCMECSFQALYKISMNRHYMKKHADLEIPFGELKTFQCNECDYKTTYSKSIFKHLQAHEQKKKCLFE